MLDITAIFSIEKPRSINIPKKAVPKAVENTINAVVKALIDPISVSYTHLTLPTKRSV